MVTTTTGVMYGVTQSGKPVALQFYISDVLNAPLRFDNGAGAGATSDTFATNREKMIITDVSLTTGPTVMTAIRMTIDGQPTGVVLPIANHLNTLNNRPAVPLRVPAGARLSGIQM